MNTAIQNNIQPVLKALFDDSKNDKLRAMKGAAKALLRPMQPSDFEHAYLSISREQGDDLVRMIKANKVKNVVEFGTSFGISTLFLAEGVLETGGHIVTTELLESKAEQAHKNFAEAGVSDLIDVRVGDAMQTLQGYKESIDLLLLDGWKDLYLPLFRMLEPNFHKDTIVYVDNADFSDTKKFLATVKQDGKYEFQSKNRSKVVVITLKQA